MIVPIIRNLGNKFTVAKVHYSLDPAKNTPEWKALAAEGMPREANKSVYESRSWMREYEINYETFAGKPVFPEFREDLNITPVKYEPGETLLVGFDFGFHRPACTITKCNQFDQWCILKSILGHDEGIDRFGKRVKNFLLTEYPGAKWQFFCDPAGHQKTDKAEKTSVEFLNALGIYPQSRASDIAEGLQIIRGKIGMRADGKVGLLVDPSCTDIIDGFKGGYRYAEAKEGEPQKEEPMKDGYFDHIFDSLRYISINYFTVIGQAQMENEIAQDPLKEQYRMGKVAFRAGSLTREEENAIIDGGGIEEFL